ncbi:ATP-binding protein [Streptomyces sp. NBC_01351]|uniref:ATP-binding protein n=1 Tax=Streptomyces sp. NBC_01351 TaxID=2903833 RepID=UPI002E3220D7|nr:ATP-binding protein [Streptomyces sp. NBC_01351]
MSQPLPLVSDLALAAIPNAVFWARCHTVDVLQHWHFPAEGTEVARLLVSELATNAIQHARPLGPPGATRPAPDTILLRLWPTPTGVVLQVGDNDPRPPTPQSPSDSALGGRGLLLTATMATRWGYHPRRPHPGKFVWAEVPARPTTALSEPSDARRDTTPLLLGQVLTALREL